MRKIINSTYVSLDGAVENPHLWPRIAAPEDPRGSEIQTKLLLDCDAVLMGRRTYDGFAPVWPLRSGDPMSDRMNTMPKYVVSSTLRDPAWANTHIITGDIIAEVTKLKNTPGKDIVQYGIGALTLALIEHNLVDELRFWIHPLVVGTSAKADDHPLRHWPARNFRRTDTIALANGIVIVSYQTTNTAT